MRAKSLVKNRSPWTNRRVSDITTTNQNTSNQIGKGSRDGARQLHASSSTLLSNKEGHEIGRQTSGSLGTETVEQTHPGEDGEHTPLNTELERKNKGHNSQPLQQSSNMPFGEIADPVKKETTSTSHSSSKNNMHVHTKGKKGGWKRLAHDIHKVDTIGLSEVLLRKRLVSTGQSNAMKLFVWNVQGLGSNRAVQNLLMMKQDHDPVLMFLMETKVDHNVMEIVRVKLVFAGKLAVDSFEQSGGLCLLWTNNVVVDLYRFRARILMLEFVRMGINYSAFQRNVVARGRQRRHFEACEWKRRCANLSLRRHG
ncbi:hypothetical protein ACOSQ4_010344 [Xanthoceras sorbifolium]